LGRIFGKFSGTVFAVTPRSEDTIMKKADNHDQTHEQNLLQHQAPSHNGSAKSYFDRPIPKPTTELGFRGISHKRAYESLSRPRRKDN